MAIKRMLVIATALCAMGGMAHAGQAQKPSHAGAKAAHNGKGTIARKLTELNQQQALLQSKLRIEQLQAQIKNAQRAIHHRAGAQAASVYTGSTLPVVSAIIGVGHKYQAILLYPHGIVTANPGDTLPGGVHVRAITKDTVRVSLNGGHTTTLMFAGQGGASEAGKNKQGGKHAQQSAAGHNAKAKG